MVDEKAVERNLLTGGLPDPDILIRTSGETRVRHLQLSLVDPIRRSGPGGNYWKGT